jgi:hypothetical protein
MSKEAKNKTIKHIQDIEVILENGALPEPQVASQIFSDITKMSKMFLKEEKYDAKLLLVKAEAFCCLKLIVEV